MDANPSAVVLREIADAIEEKGLLVMEMDRTSIELVPLGARPGSEVTIRVEGLGWAAQIRALPSWKEGSDGA